MENLVSVWWNIVKSKNDGNLYGEYSIKNSSVKFGAIIFQEGR